MVCLFTGEKVGGYGTTMRAGFALTWNDYMSRERDNVTGSSDAFKACLPFLVVRRRRQSLAPNLVCDKVKVGPEWLFRTVVSVHFMSFPERIKDQCNQSFQHMVGGCAISKGPKVVSSNRNYILKVLWKTSDNYTASTQVTKASVSVFVARHSRELVDQDTSIPLYASHSLTGRVRE